METIASAELNINEPPKNILTDSLQNSQLTLPVLIQKIESLLNAKKPHNTDEGTIMVDDNATQLSIVKDALKFYGIYLDTTKQSDSTPKVEINISTKEDITSLIKASEEFRRLSELMATQQLTSTNQQVIDVI